MSTLHPLRSLAMALLLAGAALLAACGREESREERDSAARTPGAGNAQGQPGDASAAAMDQRITAGVKTRLASDSALSLLEIQVETREGRVLLRGITPDTEVRRHAADVARTVAGVVEVKNDLSVQVPHQ